jgi:hypothetical protein
MVCIRKRIQVALITFGATSLLNLGVNMILGAILAAGKSHPGMMSDYGLTIGGSQALLT